MAAISTFAAGSMVIDNTSTSPTPSSYTPSTALAANSTFYWRVRVYNVLGQYSNWSSVRHFHTKLPPPWLVSPGNGEVTTTLPAFGWSNVSGATSYVLQVSTSPSFSTLKINKTVIGSSYTATSTLSAGKKYYWRVYAKGTFKSQWSLRRYFITQ